MIYTIIAALLITSPTHRTDDVSEIIRKTKALHESTSSAQVRFSESGSGGTFSGTILYAKGNKFRMEMPGQTMVCDGTKTWSYAPAKKQVVITKASSDGNRMTPNDIFTLFPGDYAPTLKSSSGSSWTIECTAPQSGKRIGDISHAVLTIDKKTYRLRQIAFDSPSLGSITLRITSAKYGVAIKDGSFTFVPPKGVRVVDLSK